MDGDAAASEREQAVKRWIERHEKNVCIKIICESNRSTRNISITPLHALLVPSPAPPPPSPRLRLHPTYLSISGPAASSTSTHPPSFPRSCTAKRWRRPGWNRWSEVTNKKGLSKASLQDGGEREREWEGGREGGTVKKVSGKLKKTGYIHVLYIKDIFNVPL